ncbi:MAG: hypothetical protein MZW92_67790 [Comamonadaceae bacterium]|nr:hypothetical protein [Comamonadaceae bacterium]
MQIIAVTNDRHEIVEPLWLRARGERAPAVATAPAAGLCGEDAQRAGGRRRHGRGGRGAKRAAAWRCIAGTRTPPRGASSTSTIW